MLTQTTDSTLTASMGSTTENVLTQWSLVSTSPDSATNPAELKTLALSWVPAIVPGTAAQALRAAGQWDIDQKRDFDAEDWWYRCTFSHKSLGADVSGILRFDGLATLADVWLNDQLILSSDNMFQRHAVDVSAVLRETNELVIRFRALSTELAKRRARPRWKTKLVSHQALRWIRTTLLGRIPGWSPPVAPVGPWRGVVLERQAVSVEQIQKTASLSNDVGVVEFSCVVRCARTVAVSAELRVGSSSIALHAETHEDGIRLVGQLRIDQPTLWWPHTHGVPHLYPCSLRVSVDGEMLSRDCGMLGFRAIDVNDADSGFSINVNGTSVFCRGACWTVSDIVSLNESPAELRRMLILMRDAGANMVRIGGTMVYESDTFYELCDELGIMLWQDFMFANMDYPVDDQIFLSSVAVEVEQQLQRLRQHVSVVVYCGNSEIEQQAAMLGVAREHWRNRLFSEVLPERCRALHPQTVYVPSTPSGGVMPFHVGAGITHYYGVGAYQRPLSEVRRANVRFTPECLGFSNIPEPAIVDLVMKGDLPATHDPRWKQRTPRDSGAGWDFEDVRDFYLAQLFSLDPVYLRSFDPARYIALSRVTTGEMMSRVFSEWRSEHSHCAGGLVWFLKDLWPGAGWGVLDSTGLPKACFYYLRRSWQPQSVLLTDEALDGIHVHVVNETSQPLRATLELTLLREGRVVTGQARTECVVAPRSRVRHESDQLLDGFYDVSYAYRFGPPKHDVVAASLIDERGEVLSEAFWFPEAKVMTIREASALKAIASAVGETEYEVTLVSDRFIYAVHLEAKGYLPSDNYFHLMPGRKKTVRFVSLGESRPAFRGFAEALNLDDVVRIDVS